MAFFSRSIDRLLGTPLCVGAALLSLTSTSLAVEHQSAAGFVPDISLGSDGDLAALAAGRWVVAGKDGLTLATESDDLLVSPARYESLDTRTDLLVGGRSFDLVAAIDPEAGGVVLLLGDRERGDWTLNRRIDFDDAVAEALCLYRDPSSGHVSLFTLDTVGMLEQRYVYDGKNHKMVNLSIRKVVGVPDAQACAVDDETGSLFVADEALGVRRFDADEETDAIAEPWMMVTPWGVIDGEVEDIAIDDDGALWVLVPDGQQILRRSRDGLVKDLRLPQDMAAAAIAVNRGSGGIVVRVYDEDTGGVWEQTVSADVAGTTANANVSTSATSVVASTETTPVRRYGDAADDPVVIAGEQVNGEPLILGTDKRAGLAVYHLSGEQVQFLPVGRVNNVDAVTDVMLGDRQRTIAAASNRSTGSVSLFGVEGGVVQHLGDYQTGLDDVYGLCMYSSPSGVYVFINDTSGAYEQYRVTSSGDGLTTELVRSFALPSQPEGCAADSQTRRIYLGEEGAGVWVAGAEPDGAAPVLAISLSEALVADVEGMDIYQRGERKLLVVSSQGSDSYAIYDLEKDYALVASFQIKADLENGVDGVSETDGLAVSSSALPGYPRGILVVQDGRNRMPGAPQNFKIVDWRHVDAIIKTAAREQ